MGEVLFVGGRADGRKIDVPDSCKKNRMPFGPTQRMFPLWVDEHVQRPLFSPDMPELDNYRRLLITPDISVFAFEDLDRGELMRRLVEHYKPNENTDG